jgi:hypothetical protein
MANAGRTAAAAASVLTMQSHLVPGGGRAAV